MRTLDRRTVADLATIRSHFPALERLEGGHPVGYFDGPGGTQVPRGVGQAMQDYLYRHNANTHWVYPTSVETDSLIVYARRALADFLNAEPAEIAFGQNMTTLTFHLARALGRRWGPGDEVVVTELDHQANVAPWQAIERERGITLRSVPFLAAEGRLDWEELQRAITPRTRLLAIGAASNAIGTINDVRRAAELAHAVGALIYVDAVHYAPHALVDVRNLQCDFLSCSAYKFYGPHIGVVYGRRALLEALDVPKLAPAPETAPERLETGTLSHEGIVGAAAAVDFLASLGQGDSRRERLAHAFDELHHRGKALFRRLWTGLQEIPRIRLYGLDPEGVRTPTLAFSVTGMPADEVARRLVPHGLYVSSGDFYATTVVEHLGRAAEGLVRIGCACYTSEEEIHRLVAAMRLIAV